MRTFARELTRFLEKYCLPPLPPRCRWLVTLSPSVHSGRQNIPLMVKVSSPDAAQNISKVMVHFEATTKTQKIADRGDLFYRTVWEMFDKWSVRHAFRPQLIRHSDIGWLRV